MSVNKVQLANGETIIDISDSTVTPETLAEGVTAHDASGQKITGKMAPGGGSSVQSDWNQTDSSAADFIKNKPFGDMPTGGDTLYWDGNTDGLVNVAGIGWLVSDKLPTMSDLANGGVIVATMSDGSTMSIPFTASEVSDVDGDGSFICINDVVNVFNLESIHGVAFMKNETAYISSFTIPGYTGFPVTKKMEEKYLPGAVILYADDSFDEGGYLYTSEDTSDTSKRMTKAELMETIVGGRRVVIVCAISGVTAYFTPDMVGAPGDFAMVFALAFGASPLAFYTAEYVPET